MSDLMRASRDAARAIARMNGSGRTNGSDQRGMAWGTVVSVKNQFVDVMIGGTVSGSLRYTTACDGMVEGDRVMVQYVGHEPVVVGVMSKGNGAKRVFTGTKVLTAGGGDSAVLFEPSDFENICGRAFDSTRYFVGVMNGDGAATPVHVDGATHQSGRIHAVFDRNQNGQIRVNWLIVLGDDDVL